MMLSGTSLRRVSEGRSVAGQPHGPSRYAQRYGAYRTRPPVADAHALRR